MPSSWILFFFFFFSQFKYLASSLSGFSAQTMVSVDPSSPVDVGGRSTLVLFQCCWHRGATSRVTSAVIPLALSGSQGCAKSVLKWEITSDSPDAAQRFASDSVTGSVSACELIGNPSAAATLSDKAEQKPRLLLINALQHLSERSLEALACWRKLN